MDGRHDGDGLTSDIDSGEYHGCLGDAGKSQVQLLRGQVMQLQMDMILELPTAPATNDIKHCNLIVTRSFIAQFGCNVIEVWLRLPVY